MTSILDGTANLLLRSTVRVVAMVALTMIVLAPGSAASVIERTPAELFVDAERVVSGRVDEVTTDAEGATVVTLRLERDLTGASEPSEDPDEQATPRLQVVFGAGSPGGLIADLPVPAPGDQVLWALTGEADAVSPIEGVWQGAWTVSADGWVDLRGRVLGLDGTVVRFGGSDRDVGAVLDAIAAALAGGNAQLADEVTSVDVDEDALPAVPDPLTDDDGASSPAPASDASDAFEIVIAGTAANSPIRTALQDAVRLWNDAGVDLTLRFDDDAADRVIVSDARTLGSDARVLLRRVPERNGVDLLVRRSPDGVRADALAQMLGRVLGLPPSSSGFRSGLVPRDAVVRPSTDDARALERRLRSERGDLDGDGDVDLYDLAAVAEAFGREGVALPADLDRSGRVDQADIEILRAAYDFLPASREPPPRYDREE